MKPKRKPGGGRKPLPDTEKRIKFSVRIHPDTGNYIWNYCDLHKLSAGELIDLLVNEKKGV